MRKLLAAGMLSSMVLMLAPVAQAGPIEVCAYVRVEVNGEEVVNEQQCQKAMSPAQKIAI